MSSSSSDWRFEPTLATPTAVRRIGQYDLIGPLGRGGMGIVWKGMHRHLGQTVAIKFLTPDSWADPQAVARFYREMRAVGRVVHPNLVRALDAGEYDGHHVLVMECVQGLTVRDLLARTGPLPIDAACEIVRQTALGVFAISAAGMVHRDLKPSNLFLTNEGVVKILDLGLARFLVDVDERELTASGNLLGTIDYMAPEQSLDPRSVDQRTDLYSLGCTLFALLTGGAPFAGQPNSSLEARLRAHREALPPSIETLRGDVPPALSQLVARLLAKRPEDRVGSAEELATSLREFASAESLIAIAGQVEAEMEADGNRSDSQSRKQGTSKPVTGSGIETSEFPIAPDLTTRRVRNLPDETANTSRWPKSRIMVAMGLLFAGVLAGFSFKQWQQRDPPVDDLVEKFVDNSQQDLPRNPEAPDDVPLAVRDFTNVRKLEWHDLLDSAPRPVYWLDNEGLANWTWSEPQRQLRVSNNNRGMLSLGRIDAEDYTVQIGIHQNGWAGGVGVFFGLEDWDPHSNEPGWHCYHLTVHQVMDARGRTTNRLDFTLLETATGAKRSLAFLPTTSSSESVRGLVGEAVLEITVKRGRLIEVRFDNNVLRDLVEGVNEIQPGVKWTGGFGVYVDGGDATFRNARIKLLEDG